MKLDSYIYIYIYNAVFDLYQSDVYVCTMSIIFIFRDVCAIVSTVS